MRALLGVTEPTGAGGPTTTGRSRGHGNPLDCVLDRAKRAWYALDMDNVTLNLIADALPAVLIGLCLIGLVSCWIWIQTHA